MKGNKFKKFLRNRWHGIPMGAMAIALVASMAISGIAFAAYSVLTGSGTATVVESITIEEHAPTDATWTRVTDRTGTWEFDIYPLETKTLTLKITNAGVTLPLCIGMTSVTGLTNTIQVWDGSAFVDYVPAGYSVSGDGGIGYVQFTVTADHDAETGAQTFTITIDR